MTTMLSYTGHAADGTAIGGVYTQDASPEKLASQLYVLGYQDLTIYRGDIEVGGITRDPATGARTWWAEADAAGGVKAGWR